MPFPIVFTSSAPAGGRKTADFSGPVLFGKLQDNGPPTGPRQAPSGTLLVQSTGGFTNQVVSTAAINSASLIYIAVSTGDLVGAGPPPFTGFGAPIVFVDDMAPHLNLYSTSDGDWLMIPTTTSTAAAGGTAGSGTVNFLTKWASTAGLLTSANVFDDGTTVTVTSSAVLAAAVYQAVPTYTFATTPDSPSTGLLLFAAMSSSSKTELRVLFPSGVSQVIARED
jgi:hypothetical protein